MRGLRMGVATFLAILALGIAPGCRSRKPPAPLPLTGIRAPDPTGRQYSKLLILVAVEDLGVRQRAEILMAEGLGYSGVESLHGTKFLFPGKEHGDEDIRKIVRDNGVDGILLLELRSAGSASIYAPPSPAPDGGPPAGMGHFVGLTGASPPGFAEAGAKPPPWNGCSCVLIDTASGALAWISTGTSGGKPLEDPYGAVAPFATKVPAALRREKLIDRVR